MSSRDFLVKKLNQKPQSMEAVENWDADFDMDDDFDPTVFQSSVSSSGSRQEEDEELDLMSNLKLRDDNSRQQQESERVRSISRKASRRILSQANSINDFGTVKRLGGGGSNTQRKPVNLDNEFDFDRNDSTLRLGNQLSPGHDDDGVIKGTFFDPPSTDTIKTSASPTKRQQQYHHSHPPITEEEFEDGFDFEEEEEQNKISKAEPLTSRLQKIKNEPAALEEEDLESLDEESLGVRAGSRLSEVSSSSVTSSSATNFDESEADDDDFFDGLQVPDKPQDFQEVLNQRKLEAQRLAQQEEELLLQGKKYDTIKSNGSGNSIKQLHNQEVLDFQDNEDDLDEDFLDGIDVQDDDDLLTYKDYQQHSNNNHLHRNVVVKNNSKPPSTTNLKPKQSVQFASNSNIPTASSTSGLRSKKSMPSLRPSAEYHQNQYNSIKLPKKTSRGDYQSTTETPRSPSKKLSGNIVGGENSPTKRTASSADVASSSSSLRPVQSMAALGGNNHKPPSPRKSSTRGETRLKFTKPKTNATNRGFGDGSELDALDELPTNVDQEKSFTVTPKGKNYGTIQRKPLDTYRENPNSTLRSHTKSSVLKDKRNDNSTTSTPSKKPQQQQPTSTRRRRYRNNNRQKGPGLIQQLGPPVASIVAKGHHGDMHFNPQKLIWEGNDVELKKFDSVNSKGPGLIAFISNKGVQVVGDMVFDPQKMCWIKNTGENDNHNNDEDDPFKDVEDLDVSMASSYQTTTTNTAQSSLHYQPGNSINNNGEYSVGNEFELTPEIIKKMQHEDERWQRKIKGWFSPDETYDREYLHEIRTMVMKRS